MKARVLCAVATSAVLFASGQAQPPPSSLRIALIKQPFIPNGTSAGPQTMASGGIQDSLKSLGATVRVSEIALTAEQQPEYGGWKRLGFALGHLGRAVAQRARWLFPRRAARYLPVDAGDGGGASALGPSAEAHQDRSSVARCAPGLQHAGNHAERIARRYAGGRRHRTMPDGNAARCEPRSPALRQARRHGWRASRRSARTASARSIEHRATERGRSAYAVSRP